MRALRNTQKRTRKQQNLKPVKIDQKEYEKILDDINKLEAKKNKAEQTIQRKLEPVKISLGIDKLEEQIFDLDDKIGDLWVEKERFEALVINQLSTGRKIKEFFLRIVSKRFSPKYKAICEEIFADDPEGFEEAKIRHGSRKEQFVLIFKGEEVATQLVNQLVPTKKQETA